MKLMLNATWNEFVAAVGSKQKALILFGASIGLFRYI